MRHIRDTPRSPYRAIELFDARLSSLELTFVQRERSIDPSFYPSLRDDRSSRTDARRQSVTSIARSSLAKHRTYRDRRRGGLGLLRSHGDVASRLALGERRDLNRVHGREHRVGELRASL